jgi:hypothetical protein
MRITRGKTTAITLIDVDRSIIIALYLYIHNPSSDVEHV